MLRVSLASFKFSILRDAVTVLCIPSSVSQLLRMTFTKYTSHGRRYTSHGRRYTSHGRLGF